MVGQTQVRNGQLVPGPGVKRSTELYLAQDSGPAEKRLIHYASGRDRERTNPEVK